MKPLFFASCFLSFLFFAPNTGFATVRCENVFEDAKAIRKKEWSSTPVYEAYAGGLDVKRLERDGYVLKGDRLFDKVKNVEIGVIKKFQPAYLFQWADVEFHKDLIKNHGVFNEWMEDLLKAPSQAAGRGFYISTDPFDSASYGTNLTTFKVKAPIYILEASHLNLQRYFSQSVQRTMGIAEAGIDALRYPEYEGNWFNFISNRHLQSASAELPDGALRAALDKTQALSPIKFLQQSFWGYQAMHMFFASPKSKGSPALADALTDLIRGSQVEESLKLIFNSQSENAKLLSLAILYNNSLVTSNIMGRLPDKLLQFLSLKSSDPSSFEARFLFQVLKKQKP